MPNRLLSLGFACLLAAGLAVTAAACGSSEPEPRVASVPKPSNTEARTEATPTVPASAKPISSEEWTRLFQACLATELPEMVGADGKVSGRKKTDPKFRAAVEKCHKQLPPAEEPEPEPLTAEQLASQRDYAECMRDEGITGFPDPDPTPKDPAPGEPQPPYGATNAEWERAFNKCYSIIDPQFTPGVGVG